MSAISAVHHSRKSSRRLAKMQGFSLIELLVAMAIFLIVGGAAFSLFNQSVYFATRQQNLSGLNIGLRNAMAQFEIDLAGAGQNLLASVPGASPINLGVIIHNNVPGVAAACAPDASWAYPTPSACFDSLTMVNPKTNAPVLIINEPGAGHPTAEVTNSAVLWGVDANNPNDAATQNYDAGFYKDGDELLVVTFAQPGQPPLTCDNGSYNFCLSFITLSKDAQANGNGRIQLQHNSAAADPLLLNTNGGNNYDKANGLNYAYPSYPDGISYIINLGSNFITYAVLPDPNNAGNTQLVRCAAATCTAANAQAITDQVIGFKIGAALWNGDTTGNGADIAKYFYDSSTYCSNAIGGADCVTAPQPNDPNDYSLVRAVRISMIGRTPPKRDPSLLNFQNGFDHGPYLVQQASVVVNLRNMTLNDFGN